MTNNKEKKFNIYVDGEVIKEVLLSEHQYSSRYAIDDARRSFAESLGISLLGLRLIGVGEPYKYKTNMQTGETSRNYKF